jgi:hypothetical protein
MGQRRYRSPSVAQVPSQRDRRCTAAFEPCLEHTRVGRQRRPRVCSPFVRDCGKTNLGYDLVDEDHGGTRASVIFIDACPGSTALDQ